MNLETAAHLSAANAGELERSLAKIFAHGANLVVGWHLAAHGIKVLHLPSYALSATPGFSGESLKPSKYVKTEADFHRLSNLGARVSSIKLSFDVANEAHAAQVPRTLCFRHNHWPSRYRAWASTVRWLFASTPNHRFSMESVSG